MKKGKKQVMNYSRKQEIQKQLRKPVGGPPRFGNAIEGGIELEHVHTDLNLLVHSDGRVKLPKWFLDNYRVNLGKDRINIEVKTLDRGVVIEPSKSSPEVQQLAAAKITGRLKERVPKQVEGPLDDFKEEQQGLEAVEFLKKKARGQG